jgi:hypothetical protein
VNIPPGAKHTTCQCYLCWDTTDDYLDALKDYRISEYGFTNQKNK